MTPDESRQVPAYVGISEGTHEEPATLEAAIHDAAVRAVEGGQGETPFRVVSIEFVAHNPHITAYRVIVTPA